MCSSTGSSRLACRAPARTSLSQRHTQARTSGVISFGVFKPLFAALHEILFSNLSIIWPLDAVYRTDNGKLLVEVNVRPPEPLSLAPKHLC